MKQIFFFMKMSFSVLDGFFIKQRWFLKCRDGYLYNDMFFITSTCFLLSKNNFYYGKRFLRSKNNFYCMEIVFTKQK